MKNKILLLLLILKGSYITAQVLSPNLGFIAYNQGKEFTCITVDKNNNIWAGTNRNGIYYLDQKNTDSTFITPAITSLPDLAKIGIQSLASDTLGNVWVGHNGINNTNGSGGVERIDINDLSVQHYSADRNAKCHNFMERDGLGTRNTKGIVVDINNTVWAAQWRHSLTTGGKFILTPGTVAYKTINNEKFIAKSTWKDYQNNNESPEFPYPDYTCDPKPSETPQSRNVNAISSDSTEVWISVYPYKAKDSDDFIPSRLLGYDLNGNHITSRQFTFKDVGFTSGGVFNAIYRNNSKGTWVTPSIADKGFSVYTPEGGWKHMDPKNDSIQKIIPPNTRFNNNAIWGNKDGYVFMGTNNGLLVYDGKGPVNYISSYKLYSKTNSISNSDYVIVDKLMVSNNILAGCSDKNKGGQWIATDNGIMKGVFGGSSNNEYGTVVIAAPSGKGFLVKQNKVWTYMDPKIDSIQKIIPPNTEFYENAIWSNAYGNYFLGTSNGLIVYNGRGPLKNVSSYSTYSQTEVLPDSPYTIIDDDFPSNNIIYGKSIKDSIQRIFTANGTFEKKLGFIKTDSKIGICPQNWRKRTDFTLPNSPKQCVLSQNKTSNQTVSYIENSIDEAIINNDPTYHIYQTETTIYDPRNKEHQSKYGTVENVYNMLKENAEFQAIIPFDFPKEVLGDDFLEKISHEHVKLFEKIAKKETEKIATIQSIMDKHPDLKAYGDITNINFLTWLGFVIDYNPYDNNSIYNRENYYNLQKEYNGKKSIHHKKIYRLYNTPEVSEPRAIFKDNYVNTILPEIKSKYDCVGIGLESPQYDSVIMHIDDTNFTITNYTLEGHYFHPGKITRTVLRDQETGEIYVRTIGEGTHFCKKELGEFSGKLNTIMGMILFKNVDIRLREAFKKLEN